MSDYLNISERQFAKLVEKYGKDGTIDYISRLIDERNYGLPFLAPSLTEADEDHARLLDLDSRALFKKGAAFTRYPSEQFLLSRNYISQNNAGLKASNHFHHNSRMFCDSINSPSPMRVWHNPKFRRSALSAIFTLKFKHVDRKVLAQCISMRKYVASQFRPASAKALYDRWANGGAVLDMCAGWGDRLEGFMASSANEYLGFDPNLNLHEGYRKQIARYGAGKQARIIYAPFEKAELPENHFSVAFTSPPYFSVERYSKDDDQSYLRYKNVNDWIKRFLIPLADRALASLESGGHLVLNISDVYANHTVNQLCDPMNAALKKLGAKEAAHFGYRMAKRVGSKSNQDGVFVEPCWHWRK